jgi:hypothetical protein
MTPSKNTKTRSSCESQAKLPACEGLEGAVFQKRRAIYNADLLFLGQLRTPLRSWLKSTGVLVAAINRLSLLHRRSEHHQLPIVAPTLFQKESLLAYSGNARLYTGANGMNRATNCQ